MDEEMKKVNRRNRKELFAHLRKLVKWKNNDAVRLVFLEQENLEQIREMDLTGLAELKRSPNGTLEMKFVDRVQVLTMLQKLLEEQETGALDGLIAALGQYESGDEG